MTRWLARLIHRLVDWLDGGDGADVEWDSVSWHDVLGIKHSDADKG